MNFTDTQFAKLVELMRVLEPRPQQRKDKRRAQRAEIRVPVKIKLETGVKRASWTMAELRDLSPRGAKLATDHAMVSGNSFLISLPGTNGPESAAPLVCRVAHCEAQSNGKFIVGAEFIGQLDDAPEQKPDRSAEQERIQRSILD
ncbi:MAG TPA: PilZ domain-containing protein [Tepidisphaeraceae bacterium]|jgi:hypothetical protein|nr:PilZ domain-containing protein [Tepidisphaeraceae bacterium]